MKIKFVKLKCEPGCAFRVAERLVQIPEIGEIYTVKGGFDLLVKCNLGDGGRDDEFVVNTLQTIEEVKATETLDTEAWFV